MQSDRATVVTHADLNEASATLAIEWGDGHASSYPLKYLRGECPCAGCKQEREDQRRNPFHIVSASGPQATRLRDVEPMGNYALRLVWGAGHAAGIYSFEFLRRICPCPTCREARPAEAPWVHGIYIPGG